MSVSISYNLTGRGWSECTVVIDEHRVTVTASYLSNAWCDLLGAITRVVEGQPEATALFTEEPGEFRWRFFRKGPDRLLVRILKFPDWGNQPDDDGKTVFEVECRLRTFAGAMLSASQNLFEKHGAEGYLEIWGEHEFPLDKHDKLKQALKSGEN